MFVAIIFALVFESSGHWIVSSDMMAHEEGHCREFGIDPARWRVEYGEPLSIAHRCRDYGTPLLVDACAVPLQNGDCLILYPRKENDQ